MNSGVEPSSVRSLFSFQHAASGIRSDRGQYPVVVGEFDNSGTAIIQGANSHPELGKRATARLIPSEARDSPRSAANNPSGCAIHPRLNCHDTPNLSATQANSLLKP